MSRRLQNVYEPGDYFLTIGNDGHAYEWVVTENGDIHEVELGTHFGA